MMARRQGLLVALAALTLAFFAYLAAQDKRMNDAGGPGIVAFELAGSEERAAEIVADWGEDGRDAARRSLLVDYAFLASYGAFLVLAAMATRNLAAGRGWRRVAAAGPIAIGLAAAAPLLDAIENAWLLLSLDGKAGGLAPLAGAVFATLKFAALALAIAYLLAGLALRLARRPAASG